MMLLLSLGPLLLIFGALTSATPVPSQETPHCETLEQRKEWRTLTSDQQRAYISAVKCLATKPSILKNATVDRLYDDFTYVHSTMRSRGLWLICAGPTWCADGISQSTGQHLSFRGIVGSCTSITKP